jgi:hypothetical protein
VGCTLAITGFANISVPIQWDRKTFKGKHTAKFPDPFQIIQRENLCMFNARSPLCGSLVPLILSSLVVFSQKAFKDVQHNMVRTISNAMYVLERFKLQRQEWLTHSELTVCHPCSQEYRTATSSVSSVARMIPVVAESSEYGERRAAPQDPNAPMFIRIFA